MIELQSDLRREIAGLKRSSADSFRRHVAQVTELHAEIAALKRKEFPAFDRLFDALVAMQDPRVDNEIAATIARDKVIAAAFEVVGVGA